MKTIPWILLSLAVAFTAFAQKKPSYTPDQAVARMKLPAGFSVTQFAAEPDVVQPFAFCFDDRGRVWVCENLNYETRKSDTFKQGPKGRILILEDTDGDGRFDKRKVFIENIFFPTGLQVGFGGVWVGSPPNLLFIPDKNGDDVPDAAPIAVLDGWGRQDRHETLNSFVWGPDGWLYGLHGVFTHSKVGKPGTPEKDRVPLNAGVWRYHPTRKKFEVFAWGTSNPWGLDFDSRGQAFITACVIPHLWHMVQGGRYHRQGGQHFNKHIYNDIKTIGDHVHQNYGGRKHEGGLAYFYANGAFSEKNTRQRKGGFAHGGCQIYNGGAFPKQYDGQVFMGNIHHHMLYVDNLKRRGSGFAGTHGGDFMLAHDEHFLGFNLDTGPTGALWVIDWNDADICGRIVHQLGTGRIYRVTHTNCKPVKNLNLAQLNDSKLVDLLSHKNDWYADHARRLLQERAEASRHQGLNEGITATAAETPGLLSKIYLNPKANPTHRLRAMLAMHAMFGLNSQVLLKLMRDKDETLRGWAIQCALEKKKTNKLILDQLVKMAKTDESKFVRLYLASALQRLPLAQRWDLAEALIAHEADKDDHNLPLLYWYGIEPLVPADKARALKLTTKTKIPLIRQYIVRRISAK
jgi:putative membrane-bound dehydrogenase-like protein